jgi:hypothetical protein
VKKILHKKVNEDLRQGWNVRKKVKCPIVHFFMNKLMHIMNAFIKSEEKLKRHKLSALLKKEKLKAVDFRQRSMTDKEFHMCERK